MRNTCYKKYGDKKKPRHRGFFSSQGISYRPVTRENWGLRPYKAGKSAVFRGGTQLSAVTYVGTLAVLSMRQAVHPNILELCRVHE